MEFNFDINQLFSERISILDQTLVAGRRSIGRPDLQIQIAYVIDELGRSSAKAQQLMAPITSASKLQSNTHQLYLLKDGERNGGRGVVVGFLKVGYKKLFLLNQQGQHIEAEPLCVLDFYITENLQRHGYGQELFGLMLQHKNVEAALMAYDRPSPKFLSFLARHYCLTQSVPQVNNFVVFEGFFLNKSVAPMRKVPPKKVDGEVKPYSLMEREVVHQEQTALPWPFAPPHSPQLSVSSQCLRSLSVGSSPSRVPPRPSLVPVPGGSREQKSLSPLNDGCRARRSSQQGPVTRCSLHSRYMDGKAVEPLDRQLSGRRAVGDQSLGTTDSHRVASIHTPQKRSQPVTLPPLSASKKGGICMQTSIKSRPVHVDAVTEACGAERIRMLDGPLDPTGAIAALLKRSNSSGSILSWTVVENRYTAQWVKQKQKYRSSRPW
ncbi:alpha-tubulin N-acetyltransferase 1 [Genypterus blacodes]|uniref:alpha-tubulin N-acetyltransferase 1 n=1 Tax=Genypterus blacodes TaxID=154954 RepID=UPI003F765DA0